MTKTTTKADKDSLKQLKAEVLTYLKNFDHALEVAQKSSGNFHPSILSIEQTAKKAVDIIKRNNQINSLLNSARYEKIRKREKALKSDTIIGLICCVDPRIPRVFFGREVSVWKVPAGEITTTRRTSDSSRIPSSTSLRRGLKLCASSNKSFLEIAVGHFDSYNKNHGCAGMAAIWNNLNNHESLNFKEKWRISQEPTVEDANVMLLEQTTLEAITNYYNICKKQIKTKTKKRVGVVALYDTDTIGLVLRHEKESLASSELILENKKDIEKITKARFGKYKSNFTNPVKLLDIFEDIVTICEKLIKTNHKLVKSTDLFIEKHYPDLDENQKKALRFVFVRMCALQFLIGTAQIPPKGPDHEFVHQQESPISISIQGEALGEFDTKQHFWSSPANSTAAVNQAALQLNVVRRIKNHSQNSTATFVCNSADTESARNRTSKSYGRSMESNERLVDDLVANPIIKNFILTGKMVLIPTIINDITRETIEIPDHSQSF